MKKGGATRFLNKRIAMNVLDAILEKAIDTYTRLNSGGKLSGLIAEIKEEFSQLLAQAIEQQDTEGIARLIRDALTAEQDQAEQEYPRIWDQVLQLNAPDLIDLAELLYQLAKDLKQHAYHTLLETLIKKDGDLSRLIRGTASFCLKAPEELPQRLSNVWGPLIATALQFFGPDRIAGALSSLFTSDDEFLQHNSALPDLNLIPPGSNSGVLKKMLALPDYQLPAGVIMSGLGLQYLIQQTGLDQQVITPNSSARTVKDLFAPILQTIQNGDRQAPGAITNGSVFRLCMELIRQAKEDEEVEWALLKMARFTPVGIVLIIAAILYCLITHPLPWWKLLFNEIEEDPDLRVKRLPAPQKGGPKYLIFSDVHRDARSDRREPLEFGSIDHFSDNQALYCELLDYALENGFTVIEAGDCDELWSFRDFSRRPAEKLKEIVATHQPVYDRLVKLHRQGRYIRLYGNHDACVRKPHVFEVLRQLFDADKKPEEPPFQIYDFAIIEGVKSMDESIINFGLDSEPYKMKMPMIVAHGHQWDFWNCDQNNIVGKLIVSAIATPLDFLDDPFKDAGGIAYSGSPAVNFRTMLSRAFVLSSFPAHNPARRFAHHIQHLDDMERCTVDGIYFLETLAALSGATIAVKEHQDSEKTRKMNLLCLGHTHYPQSQPYFNLKKLVPFLRPWLTSLEAKIGDLTHQLIKPDLSLVKSRYFNTGTAGWMEGLIWAIQIDETGQARLVYWLHETRPERPQTMDWELPFMDDELRKKLEAKKGAVLNTIEDLSTYIDPLIDSAFTSVLRSLAAPFEKLLGLFGKGPPANRLVDSPEALSGALCQVFLSLAGAEEPRTHTIKITLSDAEHRQIVNISRFLGNFPEIREQDRMRLACAWFLISQGIPFLGACYKEDTSESSDTPGSSPLLQSVLGLIVQLPGEQNEYSPLQCRVTLQKKQLIIKINTNPVVVKGTRAMPSMVQLFDAEYERQFRQRWKNIIRLPDCLFGSDNRTSLPLGFERMPVRIL